MAGIPKEHEKLYFDALCRTQKLETVLSLIHATYQAKKSNVTEIKTEIAKRLKNAYDLFKTNIRGTNCGSGSYEGTMNQFESQYTIGHELCIWANSNLDLTPYALAVAKGEMPIKEYFDIFFLSYFQPVNGKGVHVLYLILKYMVDNNIKEIEKDKIPSALGVDAEKENINALCNFLSDTSYIQYIDNKLSYVGKEDISTFILKCNTQYLGKEGLKKATVDLDTDDKYIKYIMSGNLHSSSDIFDANEAIEEKIKKQYAKMDFSVMESELPGLYDEFRTKFSPEALLAVSDNDIPRYMFYSEGSNKDNFCWNIEKNPNLTHYLGRIGVGSCFAYGLHFNKKCNSWATGSARKIEKLDYNGAINKAKEIRQKLVDIYNIVKTYENTQDIEDYAEIYKELNDSCGGFASNQWVVKYLHIMFPKMFTTFYSSEWQRYLISKCGLTQYDNIYQRSGELALLSQRTGLETAVVSKVLFELFGYPPELQDKDNDLNNESEEENNMIKRSPRENKCNSLNTIIYGAPGTGKTYSTAEYAVAFACGIKRDELPTKSRKELMQDYRELVQSGQIVFTTFHQSYSYEDFIQGLRPTTNDGVMNFEPVDGVFKRIAEKAMEDTEKDYVLIIDEINRGNISKIFGELITLIEEDKRWGEENQLSVILPSGEEFAVPNNLYIIGTMNSADKSISLIDTALRRRFEFVEVSPNATLVSDDVLKQVLTQLNLYLKAQFKSSDLLIGHAYFIGKDSGELANILNKNIIPLLYEYFYDDEKKVKNALVAALEGVTKVNIKESDEGRIKVE